MSAVACQKERAVGKTGHGGQWGQLPSYKNDWSLFYQIAYVNWH